MLEFNNSSSSVANTGQSTETQGSKSNKPILCNFISGLRTMCRMSRRRLFSSQHSTTILSTSPNTSMATAVRRSVKKLRKPWSLTLDILDYYYLHNAWVHPREHAQTKENKRNFTKATSCRKNLLRWISWVTLAPSSDSAQSTRSIRSTDYKDQRGNKNLRLKSK